MELLEERDNALIILEDDRKLRVVEKNPYTLLKYTYFQGKRIRFIAAEGTRTASIQEKETDGVFDCAFNGSSVIIENSKIEVASSILDAQKSGRLDAILSLWKLKHTELFLGIVIKEEGSSIVELTTQGQLFIPKPVLLEIVEWIERPDGARVVKVILRREDKLSRVDRIFTHEISSGGRTRVIVNDIAVALIGRDETGQYWMHVVPPEYRRSPIWSCEMWLSGGEEGKDELIDV